jgi:hypothetical protein
LPTVSTCSYAAWRADYGQPIRITLGSPRRPEPTGREQWLYVAELAPSGWYFNAEPGVFAARYREQLDRLAGDIEAKLSWLAEDIGPICLCCYERRVRGPEDCHRRIWAAWWTERHPGEVVPELDGRS